MGGMMGMGNMARKMDPFVQKLEVQALGNSSTAYINRSQIGCVLGRAGTRIREIQDMSGATVVIECPDKGISDTNFMRMVSVTGQPQACSNAMWLIQVCINAYCEAEFSLAHFSEGDNLNIVMNSGAYGMPPMAAGAPVAEPT